MRFQKRFRWILFGVFLVLLLIGMMYASILRKENPKPMKNALPVQTPETSIKHAVLQELSQQKKTLGGRTTNYRYTSAGECEAVIQ
ncbi:hypothetical protein ACT7C6_35830 [Bacillus paranthracis]